MKESKVFCTTQKCLFEANNSPNCLVEHYQKVHKWKESPCTYENCKFVAYSTASLSAHQVAFHSKHKTYRHQGFSCNWKNCQSTFQKKKDLKLHLTIHNNDLLECTFCPYRTSQQVAMNSHYRFHYKMFDEHCELCDKKFTSKVFLNRHIEVEHSKENYVCHICKVYSGPKPLLQRHISRKHNLLSRWNQDKMTFETFSRE